MVRGCKLSELASFSPYVKTLGELGVATQTWVGRALPRVRESHFNEVADLAPREVSRGVGRKDNLGCYTAPLNQRGLSDWLELRREWHEQSGEPGQVWPRKLTDERLYVAEFPSETLVFTVNDLVSAEILRTSLVAGWRTELPQGWFDWEEIRRSGRDFFSGIFVTNDGARCMWGWEVASILWLAMPDVEWRDNGLALNCAPVGS